MDLIIIEETVWLSLLMVIGILSLPFFDLSKGTELEHGENVKPVFFQTLPNLHDLHFSCSLLLAFIRNYGSVGCASEYQSGDLSALFHIIAPHSKLWYHICFQMVKHWSTLRCDFKVTCTRSQKSDC